MKSICFIKSPHLPEEKSTGSGVGVCGEYGTLSFFVFAAIPLQFFTIIYLDVIWVLTVSVLNTGLF